MLILYIFLLILAREKAANGNSARSYIPAYVGERTKLR